jgi:hypothetical protein
MLYASYVAVAHQYNLVAMDSNNAVYYIAASLDPCQYDMPHLEVLGFYKVYALLAANDKG